MNHISKKVLATITTPAVLLSSSAAAGLLTQTAVFAASELKSENISFEYLTTSYNGQEQRPEITVTSGGKTLTPNIDFTVSYPEDCKSVGKKTVTINGIGGFSGSFSATYIITPLDLSSENIEVSITAEPCYYNGYPQTPRLTVKAAGLTLTENDYTALFSDNTNPSDKAVCELFFKGNFTGKRAANFTVSKGKIGELVISIPVHQNDTVTYDLTPILPEGATLGKPIYYSWNFTDEGEPRVLFNELKFNCDRISDSTGISVPVVNSKYYEDFTVVFYANVTNNIIPKLTVKDISRAYNDEPVTPDELTAAGCYAEVGGKRLDGTWSFWTEPSGEICSSIPYTVSFTPSDPRYERVEQFCLVTISKNKPAPIAMSADKSATESGGTIQVTVSNIPEKLADNVLLSADFIEGDYFTVTDVPSFSDTKRIFEITCPYRSGLYTITAEIPETATSVAVRSSIKIAVGDVTPPNQTHITTETELSELIEKAAVSGTVNATGIQSISAPLVKAAAAKNLTLEVSVSDSCVWLIDMKNRASALDLSLKNALIPPVLVEKIGGVQEHAFTVLDKTLSGSKLRVSVSDGKFANLFYYNTDGTLSFVSCAAVGKDKTAVLEIGDAGKYVVITDDETKLFGDINNDCNVNSLDILMLVNAVLEGIEPPSYDLSGDGHVNALDILRLVNLVLGM